MSDRDSNRPGEAGTRRKLAAILSADVVGFSRHMGVDEVGTHTHLMAYRQIIDRLIDAHDGRTVGTAGDSVLGDFPSIVSALDAAVAIQGELHEQNQALTSEQRLEFRIGLNLGDVIVDGDDIFGDGVNVAARLEGLADPGGICISDKVYEEVKNKVGVGFRDRGTHRVKNIAEPIHVYSVDPEGGPSKSRRSRRPLALASTIAVLGAVSAIVFWLLDWGGYRDADGGRRDVFSQRIDPPTPSDPNASAEFYAKPTIAVLPFENQSAVVESSYFSQGITQDIIGALGRFANLRVISWDAVLQYETAPVTLDRVASDLGVRYVVAGNIRRDPTRVRVAVRLSDAAQGVQLWSERYDQDIGDIFSVQEGITQGIVGALAVRLTAIEQKRTIAKPTDNLVAYDFVLQGRQLLQRETRPDNLQARARFEKAIGLEPEYADALVGLGWTHNHDAAYGWAERSDRSLQKGFDLAQKAIRLDAFNSSAHTLLSYIHVQRGRHSLALAEIDRAIALNPSEAEAHGWRGWIMLATGQKSAAIESSEMALRFNPNAPPSVSGNLGWAYFLEGRHQDAIAMLETNLGPHPGAIFGYAALAASYAGADRLDDAEGTAAKVRSRKPFFDVASFSQLFRDPTDRARIAEALHAAGLE